MSQIWIKTNFQTLSYDYRSFLQNHTESSNNDKSFCLIGKTSQQFYKSSSRQEGETVKVRVNSHHLKARNKKLNETRLRRTK